ncbi:MAG: TOBE domain-containing protein, partial [Rubrivivax sp.]
EALTMSDRVAVFNAGVIQQLDTPDRLYEEPANAFVAGFIGENNRLMGTVASCEGTRCTVQLDGRSSRAATAAGTPGGPLLPALAVACGEAGSRTMLSLRPERVRLNPEPDTCDTVAPATVTDLTYLGDHLRLRVRAFEDSEFVLKLPNASSRRAVAAGDSIRIGWRAEDCRALDVPA